MLFYNWTKHKDVIKVNSHAMDQVGEHQIHQALECCQCIPKPYGNNKVFKQSMWHYKGGFLLITLTYTHLIVCIAQVYGA